jgi:hypothetical protein
MDLIGFLLTVGVPVAAITGAGLSMFNTYQNMKTNRPNVKVSTDYKVKYESWPNQDQITDGYETIVVTNCGLKTVTLSHGVIQDYKGIWQTILEKLHLKSQSKIRQVEIFNSDEGIELSSWKNYELRVDDVYFYEVDSIFGQRMRQKKVIVVFTDQVGNQFKSKPFLY